MRRPTRCRKGGTGLCQFARFMGFADRDSFAAVLVEHLQKVQGHYATCSRMRPRRVRWTGTSPFPPTMTTRRPWRNSPPWLSRPCGRQRHHPRLAGGAAARDALAGSAGKPHTAHSLILEQLSRGGDPDGALFAMDSFLKDLSGPQILLALQHHPDLVRLLTTVLVTAPRVRETLARRPSLFDALLDPAFFDILPDAATLEARLDALLEAAASDEDQLDSARRFRQEQHVLIGVRVISGTLPAARAGEAYATLAEVIIRACTDASGRASARRMATLRARRRPCWPWASLAGGR